MTRQAVAAAPPLEDRGSTRARLRAWFAANRRLFKAYVLRQQVDRRWTGGEALR